MPTVSEREALVVLGSFTVEADHPRNADLLLQSIPNCRLRSTIRADRYITDAKNGEKLIPESQSRNLGKLPKIPGMTLSVNPAKLSYEIIDPLHEDKDFCEKLQTALNRDQGTRSDAKLKGVPPQNGTLDVHRMKTLCREVVWLLEAGDVKVVKGDKPTLKATDALPGKYLLNPGSTMQNSQPMFEVDLPAWTERMTMAGV